MSFAGIASDAITRHHGKALFIQVEHLVAMPEETPFLENNPPKPRSETSAHMPSSQGAPSERAFGNSEENSLREDSLEENLLRAKFLKENFLQESSPFIQLIHLEKEKTNEN